VIRTTSPRRASPKGVRGASEAPSIRVRRRPGPGREAGPAERRLWATLSRCTANHRLVLAMILVERLTPREAAAALGIPVTHLERTYHRLVARLKQSLGGTLEGLPQRARPAGLLRLRRAS